MHQDRDGQKNTPDSKENEDTRDREDGSSMSLIEEWKAKFYNTNADRRELEQFANRYFEIEKEIYAKLLENPDEEVKGTVKELADRFGVNLLTMTGFLDGIDESLKVSNPLETMDENTEVNLIFDKEKLYRNMVDAKADWLYELPQWDKIFSEEERKELYRTQKKSKTVVKGKKIFPNDPCPCGSGKKYKYCCGRKK